MPGLGLGLSSSRARSAGGFSPDSITGLQVWLDASQITGLSDGAAVATWSDLSGNGRNATQASAGARPTYQTNELNGLPVVRFDDTDDSLGFGNIGAAFPTAAMLFIVATVVRGGYSIYNTIDNASYWRFGGNGLGYNGCFRTTRLDATGTMPDSGSSLFRLASSAAAFTLHIDGASIINGAAEYNAGDSHSIGALVHAPGCGDIAEVLAYDSVLSAGNISAIEQYLNGKWL